MGYGVTWALLNAADYGAAQRRVRLVMIASADHRLPKFPTATHEQPPADGSLPLLATGKLPWVSLGQLLSQLAPPDPVEVVVPSGKRADQIHSLTPGTGVRTGGTVEHQRPGGHWGYRQDCFLADLSLPSRTIRAASTPDWIRPENGPLRRLTSRECSALQGFPAEWRFVGTREAKFRLIGNAVQTDMGAALGRTILGALALGAQSKPTTSHPWPQYFRRRIRGAAADHKANAATRQRRSTGERAHHVCE